MYPTLHNLMHQYCTHAGEICIQEVYVFVICVVCVYVVCVLCVCMCVMCVMCMCMCGMCMCMCGMCMCMCGMCVCMYVCMYVSCVCARAHARACHPNPHPPILHPPPTSLDDADRDSSSKIPILQLLLYDDEATSTHIHVGMYGSSKTKT